MQAAWWILANICYVSNSNRIFVFLHDTHETINSFWSFQDTNYTPMARDLAVGLCQSFLSKDVLSAVSEMFRLVTFCIKVPNAVLRGAHTECLHFPKFYSYCK